MIGKEIPLTYPNISQRGEGLIIPEDKTMLRHFSLLETNLEKQFKNADEEPKRRILPEEKHLGNMARRMGKHPNSSRLTLNLSSAKSAIRRDMTVYSTVQNSQNSFPGEQM